MSVVYIENWLALGACIYSRKTADAALSALGLRKEIKRSRYTQKIEASALVALREKRFERATNSGRIWRIVYILLEIAYWLLG